MSRQNKSNKIQIIRIVVGAIVTLTAAFTGVFSNEVRKAIYDFLYDVEPVELVSSNISVPGDDSKSSKQDISQSSPTVDKNSAAETQSPRASESTTKKYLN